MRQKPKYSCDAGDRLGRCLRGQVAVVAESGRPEKHGSSVGFPAGVQIKPIEFLKECEAWILEGSLTLAVNIMITSIEFRGKARDLGFEAKGSAEDAGLRPKAKAMPRGTQNGVLSYEVIDQRS